MSTTYDGDGGIWRSLTIVIESAHKLAITKSRYGIAIKRHA